jgi:predicted DNA-binding transcriptional regulator AlpA
MGQLPHQHSPPGHGPYGPDDLLNEAQACALLGGRHVPLHRSSFWRGIKLGVYPKPLKMGPGGFTNRWLARELFEVIENASAARSTENAVSKAYD